MRRTHRNLLTALAVVLALAACTQDGLTPDAPQAAPEIRIYAETATRANEDEPAAASSADDAVFLFWDFGDVLGGTPAPNPLLAEYPDQTLDAYKRPNPPYDTGELYPDGNRRVMATGYAPSSLTRATRADGTPDYETLSLPPDGLCKTDVLTSVQPIVASASLPFDREDGETLQFMHAQSRVTFIAMLADDMGKFIRNVRITLEPTAVAGQVKWDREQSLYVPQAGTEAHTLVQPDDYQLTSENPLEVGWAYIVPRQTELAVTLTIDRSETVDFDEYETLTFPATLPFDIARDPADDWDAGKDTDRLYANEAYTFIIVFGEEGIELVGNKCPWENGGYLVIPIYPL